MSTLNRLRRAGPKPYGALDVRVCVQVIITDRLLGTIELKLTLTPDRRMPWLLRTGIHDAADMSSSDKQSLVQMVALPHLKRQLPTLAEGSLRALLHHAQLSSERVFPAFQASAEASTARRTRRRPPPGRGP